MMRDAVDMGTGQAIRARFGVRADVAGKTGTTQKNTDGWFIMMHPELVAGARVGFNQERTMGEWGSGARSALPMVGEVFQQALRNKWIDPAAQFGKPRLAMTPSQRLRDTREGWSVRGAFNGLREQVRAAFK